MHLILPLKMQTYIHIWDPIVEGMYLPTNSWIIRVELKIVLI